MKNKKVLLSVMLLLFTIVADQLVKLWAVSVLKPRGSMTLVPGLFGLCYAENTGASFSIFAGKRWFLLLITAAAIIFMIWYLLSGRITHKIGYIGFLLVVGGAVGNFIDRFLNGYVVDMFELLFINFAIFNVADLFVTVGGILCGIYFLFYDEDFKIEKNTGS